MANRRPQIDSAHRKGPDIPFNVILIVVGDGLSRLKVVRAEF